MYRVEIFRSGSICVYVLKKFRESGKEECQVVEHLERYPKEFKKARALIDLIISRGTVDINNRTKVEHLKKYENFYELKPKPLRILGIYYEGRRALVLCETFKKDKKSLPDSFYKKRYKKYRGILNGIM